MQFIQAGLRLFRDRQIELADVFTVAPRRAPLWVWLETIGLTLLTLAFTYWFDSADPLLLGARFPWIWFAPVLLALRYGVPSGVLSTVVLAVAWFLLVYAGDTTAPFPKSLFLGGFLLVMVCGEYSSLWRTRVRRVNELNVYIDERLERLTRQHYLLRLSHERLEQNLISRPVTLRDALARLKQLIVEQGSTQILPGAQDFLVFLAQYCQITSAGLYPMRDEDTPIEKPASYLGAIGDLKIDDPLVKYCLEKASLCHVQVDKITDETYSRYLVVAPVRTSTGRTIGILAIEEMPFFALNRETLQTLSVLIAYYADGSVAADVAHRIRQVLPDCPDEFAAEAHKLHSIQQTTGIPSSIVALVFGPSGRREDLYGAIRRQKRGLDMLWEAQHDNRQALITLMPLAGDAAVEGYVARIEGWLKTQHGLTMEEAQMAVHTTSLSDSNLRNVLYEVYWSCFV